MRSRTPGAWRPLGAALGGVALAVLWSLPAPSAIGATAHVSAVSSTNYDFARLVLADGGWPQSANNVTVLTQWLRAEEPPSHWWDRDNPLNNGLGSGGGSGLGSYGSLVTAARDVAQNLEHDGWGYPKVASDLAHSAAPGVTARAIWRSAWAAGHYGWGADWETTPVPSVAAPPSTWRDPAGCAGGVDPGTVGPCTHGFATTGAGWHYAMLPSGGEELWAIAGRGRTPSTATWSRAMPAGTYEIDAYVPAQFADAMAAYVVVDARGGHRVVVNQEPFDNAWVPLGDFSASDSAPLRVTLRTASSGSAPGTYLAASALRFVSVGSSRARARRASPMVTRRLRPPWAPQGVTAVAGDASAAVSWLAPSKDGGAPIASYVATAIPGGATCRAIARAAVVPGCTISGLRDGRAYSFVVRASTRAGTSRPSARSAPVRPLAVSVITVRATGTVAYGHRVLLRATVSPAASGGLVLFALDGEVLPGCQGARVVAGHATCATRLEAVGRHQVLASFSGGPESTGAEVLASLRVLRASTSLHAAAGPSPAAPLAIVTLRAWGLPGPATGVVVFAAGAARLCATGVRSGGGSCRFRVHLAAGVHDVVATYHGNRDYSGSVAHATLRVVVTPPSTTSRHGSRPTP